MDMTMHVLLLSIFVLACVDKDARKYASRIGGLLLQIGREIGAGTIKLEGRQSFYVVGGECNYLYVYDKDAEAQLRYVPYDQWATDSMKSWSKSECKALLEAGRASLEKTAQHLGLRFMVIQKERSVGIIPSGNEGSRASVVGSDQNVAPGESVSTTVVKAVESGRKSFALESCDLECIHNHESYDGFSREVMDEVRRRASPVVAWSWWMLLLLLAAVYKSGISSID